MGGFGELTTPRIRSAVSASNSKHGARVWKAECFFPGGKHPTNYVTVSDKGLRGRSLGGFGELTTPRIRSAFSSSGRRANRSVGLRGTNHSTDSRADNHLVLPDLLGRQEHSQHNGQRAGRGRPMGVRGTPRIRSAVQSTHRLWLETLVGRWNAFFQKGELRGAPCQSGANLGSRGSWGSSDFQQTRDLG